MAATEGPALPGVASVPGFAQTTAMVVDNASSKAITPIIFDFMLILPPKLGQTLLNQGFAISERVAVLRETRNYPHFVMGNTGAATCINVKVLTLFWHSHLLLRLNF
jgi:hypothetical protein